jgi:very-short-patch-repair endonuclease
MKQPSPGEAALLLHIRALELPRPEREYKFHHSRRWRFDFAWPGLRLVVEVEGGTWARGRHTRGAGFERDCEKYNAAALLGWRVLRFTTTMVEDGRAIETLKEFFESQP